MSAAEVIQASSLSASEIAGVMGISPWEDPWIVYARKYKLIEPQQETQEMYWGKQLQSVIARVFSERMALPVEWWDKRIFSKERPWQSASPDAFVLREDEGGPICVQPPDGDEKRRAAILEIKTASLHNSGEWDRDSDGEDGVPEHYLAQVEWQMSVCGLDLAYIAVLIAGNDFRIYKIPHDPVLEEILVEEGERFWREHILAKIEPPISGSERARQYLRKRFPREREKLRPATQPETEWLNQWVQLRALLDAGEDRKKELENQITQAIGEAEGLEWDRGKLTWKRIKDRNLTNWEGLAKQQIARYSTPEQEDFIRQFTHTEPGYRRIYFREAK